MEIKVSLSHPYVSMSKEEMVQRLRKASELGLEQAFGTSHNACQVSLKEVQHKYCGWGAILETIRLEQPDRFTWSWEGKGSTFHIIPTDREDFSTDALYPDADVDDYVDKIMTLNDGDRLGFLDIAAKLEELAGYGEGSL